MPCSERAFLSPRGLSDLTAKRLKDGLTQPFAGEGLYTLWLDGAFYGVAEAGGGVIRARTKLC